MVGILALGYVAFALLDARLYQARESKKFEQARLARNAAPSEGKPERAAVSVSQQEASTPKGRTPPAASESWGKIEIPSIGLSSMIREGIDTETLRRGVGHVPGTAFPGRPGNVALAGHRDTFFRELRRIHNNDEITLTTFDGIYRYRVDLVEIVAPEAVEVLSSSDRTILTLVTCYPFSFVGPAPQRYIVRAYQIPD